MVLHLCNSLLLAILHLPPTMPPTTSSFSDRPTRQRKPNTTTATATAASTTSSLLCKHSPSATLDILILILVLCSCTFLITSYFAYIFTTLSRLLPALLVLAGEGFCRSPSAWAIGFLIAFAFLLGGVEIYSHYRSRKCKNPACRGLKKAMECDIQLQTEECLRSSSRSGDLDGLPWKGGIELHPEYKFLQSELRRMAPPNGRALLLFRAPCGCPVAKLEAWGPKRTRKHKKGMGTLALDGVADHC